MSILICATFVACVGINYDDADTVRSALVTNGFLRTSNTNIVDEAGRAVQLRGVNLGGWLYQEAWMSPNNCDDAPISDIGGPDEATIRTLLNERFGTDESVQRSLMDSWADNWITTTDLDRIKNHGYNLVRVPVSWLNFFRISGGVPGSIENWRGEAGFKHLDWLIYECEKRGIYVIIDMHLAVGGHYWKSTESQYRNRFWFNGEYQANTAWLWWQIANRYKDKSAVAGYDIINEPTGADLDNDGVAEQNEREHVWAIYDWMYDSIRSADARHMIFMETGGAGDWTFNSLPSPSTWG